MITKMYIPPEVAKAEVITKTKSGSSLNIDIYPTTTLQMPAYRCTTNKPWRKSQSDNNYLPAATFNIYMYFTKTLQVSCCIMA